jgi:hypothetical protein
MAPTAALTKPVAFIGPATQVPGQVPASAPSSSGPIPSIKVSLPDKAAAGAETKPAEAEKKRRVEGALTAAATRTAQEV